MLTIAYGGDQRDALRSHRQEVCYRAQGFTVRDIGHDATSVKRRESRGDPFPRHQRLLAVSR